MGTNNTSLPSNMGNGASPGASHRAFAEYLPNAKVFGADVDKNILFDTERIKTTFVDQLDFKTFEDLNTTFGGEKFDLIIDDGLHSAVASFNQLRFALRSVKRPGWIVIEDVGDSGDNFRQYRVADYIIRSGYTKRTLQTFMWSFYRDSRKHVLYVLHLL
jgi:23S rRNA U2552 (ribose-2'-O)-methylase RlmE/FtsJ